MMRGSRRLLFLIGGNLLSLALILAAAAVVGEAWLRWRWPFLHGSAPTRFLPKVGVTLRPDQEVRWTNRRDFWTVSRTNGWGFLDREPVSPERAAAGCHVAFIGDSVVAAREVPIADKFHVRFEELAARALPEADVTTSAFGISNTGQINQLPLYDEFARRLRPRLLVLVFVFNDFRDNQRRWDTGRRPWTSARRNGDGGMRLLPPFEDGQGSGRAVSSRNGSGVSWFGELLGSTFEMVRRGHPFVNCDQWRRTCAPARAGSGCGFQPCDWPPHWTEDALEFTAFGFDRFRERADRDGAALAILATHTMGTRGHPPFDRLTDLAAARGIPVIDQFDHIRRRGASPDDGIWDYDLHWNARGHQWAAEALLEHLKREPEVCARPRTGNP